MLTDVPQKQQKVNKLEELRKKFGIDLLFGYCWMCWKVIIHAEV